jgi:hypothetical protein
MENADSDEDGLHYLLDLHLYKVGLDNGYWATFRVFRIDADEGRPNGLQYSLTLHDDKDERILGYDNAHPVDEATGPARRSRRPKAFDHIDRKGKRSIPYRFTTPLQLLTDFWSDVEEILKEEELS